MRLTMDCHNLARAELRLMLVLPLFNFDMCRSDDKAGHNWTSKQKNPLMWETESLPVRLTHCAVEVDLLTTSQPKPALLLGVLKSSLRYLLRDQTAEGP